MIRKAIKLGVEGKDLSKELAETSMKEIMSNESSEAQIAALLVALRMKREAPEEIAAFARVMREHCEQINPTVDGTLVDTCGTGGDSRKTFNVSTAAAFVAAGAGVQVAKHGNRSVTSKCGSADVLEELGVNLELSPEHVEKAIEKIGIGFMFAPKFHSAMKHALPVRKELGIRTIFNVLGPLTNPANAEAQVLGVYEPLLTEKMAQVLGLLGTKHALVVHSDGMDEIGLGRTKISELKNQQAETYYLDEGEFGFEGGTLPAPQTVQESAVVLRDILNGIGGAAQDIVVLNAAAAIYVGGKANTIKEGIELAEDSIASGRAIQKLEGLTRFGRESNGHT